MAQIVRFNDRGIDQLLKSEFGSLVRDVFGGVDPFQVAERAIASQTRRFLPEFDMRETAESYVITADIPGVSSNDLSIDLKQNVLTISGKRDYSKSEETETVHCAERSHGSFSRAFRLGENVDESKIAAELSDGVLLVSVPKAAEAAPRKIPVSVK